MIVDKIYCFTSLIPIFLLSYVSYIVSLSTTISSTYLFSFSVTRNWIGLVGSRVLIYPPSDCHSLVEILSRHNLLLPPPLQAGLSKPVSECDPADSLSAQNGPKLGEESHESVLAPASQPLRKQEQASVGSMRVSFLCRLTCKNIPRT